MAITPLTSTTNAVGMLGEESTPLTQELVTMFVTGLTMTKVAVPSAWAMGELAYTITITNETETDYTDISMIEVLASDTVFYVPGSAMLGDVPLADATYDAETGELNFFPDAENLLNIPTGEAAVITFRVDRITP